MQKIECWAVREQYAYDEDDIHYFTSQELAKEFYDFEYNDYIRAFSDIKKREVEDGICILNEIGEFVYSITLYETVVKFYDEKFW